MNKDQIARKVLQENPDVKEVFITSDGYPFLTENAANLHATKNATGKVLTVTTYQREPGDGTDGKKGTGETTQNKKDVNGRGNVDDRIEAIKKAKTLDEVQKLLEGENSKKVKDVANSVIKLLSEPKKLNPMQQAKADVEAISKMTTTDEVTTFIKGKTAPSVLKAADAKIAELSGESNDNSNTDQ